MLVINTLGLYLLFVKLKHLHFSLLFIWTHHRITAVRCGGMDGGVAMLSERSELPAYAGYLALVVLITFFSVLSY